MYQYNTSKSASLATPNKCLSPSYTEYIKIINIYYITYMVSLYLLGDQSEL